MIVTQLACWDLFLFIQKRSSYPSNKVVRLIFQPAEESVTNNEGAEQMIKNGCLNGVNEIYGYHNHNLLPMGILWCNKGPVMSQPTTANIKIIGDGGHGSEP
jgi:hippurate hydrolase